MYKLDSPKPKSPDLLEMSSARLVLRYDAYAEIKLPVDHAKKLDSGEWTYWIKWGTIYYTDDDGVEHEVDATEPETRCKFPEDETFEYYDQQVETQELYEKNLKAAAEAKARGLAEAFARSNTQKVPEIIVSETHSDALENHQVEEDGTVQSIEH